MDVLKYLASGKTTITIWTVVILTWLGCYLNMFDPGIWQELMWPVLGAAGIRKGINAYRETRDKKKPEA